MRKLQRSVWTCLAASGLALCGGIAAAAELGTIEGQIVLDGDAPALDPLVRKGDSTAKDAAVCAAEEVPNEALIVDPTSKGIANVFVFMRKAPAGMPAELKSSEKKTIEFDQKGCRYLPHVLLVRTDQTVNCVSSDAVSHNVHTNPFANEQKNFIVAPGATKPSEVTMPQPENSPIPVKCDIHPWMVSHWLVTDNPYAAITDKDGKFKIEKLPVGKHKFAIWHESFGWVNRNLEVNVKAGDNTVPVQKAPVAKLKIAK
jgi:hypothetical protein